MDAVNKPAASARLLWKDLPLIVPISLLQGAAAGTMAGLLVGGPIGWLCGYAYAASARTVGVTAGVLMILLLIAASLKPEPLKSAA